MFILCLKLAGELMSKQKLTPLDRAIRAVGDTQTTLARLVGCSPQNITNIKARGGKIPSKKQETREKWLKATGLSERDLFPDRF
jgi:hypothetical protein